ncbi:hypothetical protein GSI_12692 [Ganoderma sinense ZZ0214-1]|uniref:F-box domain-containing protein n=1 Tax=Ganoderma sinense ZZ0214-1 TaxID=1077348 RepID=A0A2G8RTH1_9APHY|nr:hypothetical protein GSI_12692 [Ganoderma sinense ZZ0214-1]
MPATYFHLPPELQFLIQDFISPTDLRTHVCVFLSDPRCVSLYSDKFWSHLLWNNGIGQLSDENETQASWCDIAVSAITTDGFCTHPQCGEALLEYNRARMQETSQHLRPLVPMVVDENYEGEQNTAIHSIVGHIDFRPSNEVNPWDKPSVSDDAHLRPSGQVRSKSRLHEDEREYLSTPPLAARGFATFAPTASFLYCGLYGIELEHSTLRSRALRRPLAVLDVLGLLQME